MASELIICGVINYAVTKSDDSALDSSIFTYTSAALTLDIASVT